MAESRSRCGIEGHELILSVSDSGPGVPVEYRERVFERFFRVEHLRAARSRDEVGLAGVGIGALHRPGESSSRTAARFAAKLRDGGVATSWCGYRWLITTLVDATVRTGPRIVRAICLSSSAAQLERIGQGGQRCPSPMTTGRFPSRPATSRFLRRKRNGSHRRDPRRRGEPRRRLRSLRARRARGDRTCAPRECGADRSVSHPCPSDHESGRAHGRRAARRVAAARSRGARRRPARAAARGRRGLLHRAVAAATRPRCCCTSAPASAASGCACSSPTTPPT